MKIRENAEAAFDWIIELELQRDGGHELLTEVIRMVSFPPEKIREALSERFVDIQILESDGAISDGWYPDLVRVH